MSDLVAQTTQVVHEVVEQEAAEDRNDDASSTDSAPGVRRRRAPHRESQKLAAEANPDLEFLVASESTTAASSAKREADGKLNKASRRRGASPAASAPKSGGRRNKQA